MYVFAHLGEPPSTPKCAKGQLYGSTPSYMPGGGPGSSPSSSSWVPLAVAGALGLGLLWFVAKGATPVLEENPKDSWETWAEKMVTMAEIREPTRTGKQVTRETLETISRETKEPRTKMRADVLLQYGYERWEKNPSVPSQEQWNKLRAQYLEADRAYDDLDVKLSVKYGKREWAPRADLKKIDQLRNRKTRIGDKMLAILDKVSPRDWHHGVPAHWIYSELSWEDAVRPANEPLSVTPPTAYGYSSPMRDNPHSSSWLWAALLVPGVPPFAENPKKMKRTEFEIATREGSGRATRMGYVEGDFATHKERYFWEFTHLPTGMSLSTYPVHETKASALAHLHKLATEGPPEHVKRLLERYPGWGGARS